MRVTIASRKRHSPAAAAIRLAQGWRAWSHTADLMPDLRTTVEALALRGGVVPRQLADLVAESSDWIAVAWHPASDSAALASDEWLAQQIGADYDWTGAIGTAWGQLRQMDDPARWWCSELSAVRAARAGAITISPYIRGVMPTTCIDLLIAAGGRLIDRSELLQGRIRQA